MLFVVLMFPYQTADFIRYVLFALVLSGLAAMLSTYIGKNWRRVPSVLLLAILLMYGTVLIAPADRYGALPSGEMRVAASAILTYDDLPESILFEAPSPPYSRHTAALHRYREEAPEFSWMIAFDAPGESADTYHLFNIRNDHIGTTYPALLDAENQSGKLWLLVLHDGIEVEYNIPIDGKIRMDIPGKTIEETGIKAFSAVVIPHYLSVKGSQRFQSVYWRILELIKK